MEKSMQVTLKSNLEIDEEGFDLVEPAKVGWISHIELTKIDVPGENGVLQPFVLPQAVVFWEHDRSMQLLPISELAWIDWAEDIDGENQEGDEGDGNPGEGQSYNEGEI